MWLFTSKPNTHTIVYIASMYRPWSYTQDKSRISPPIINFCGFSPLLTTKPGNISSDINISSLCMTTLSEEQRFIHRKSLRHLFRPEIVNISVYCYSARWDLTTMQRYIRERSNNITLNWGLFKNHITYLKGVGKAAGVRIAVSI